MRLPTTDGPALVIRRDTRPEQIHRDIYRVLRIPERIPLPIKAATTVILWKSNATLRIWWS